MLKRSIIISGGLHVAVIVATTMAWPHVLELTDESPPVVPIDLVDVTDVTNITPTVEEKKPEPPNEEAPPPQAEPPPPPPPQAEVAPPDLDKTPKPKPEPPKEPEQVAAPKNPVMPRRKPQPDSQRFDVDSVLALLDKRTPKAPPQPPKPEQAKPAETPRPGIGEQNAMTLDIKDALLAQMRECWNVPVGAPNPEQLIVQVRVFLTPDGSLQQPPQLETATRAAEAANPYMRTAAEAALRAVNVCAPYKRLPKDRYETWHEIIMTFDPSKMIGR